MFITIRAWMPLGAGTCVPLCEDTWVYMPRSVCTLGSELKFFPEHIFKGVYSDPTSGLLPKHLPFYPVVNAVV